MSDGPVKSSKRESLDEIVSHSAIAIADQIQTAASWDASEMQLQIEVAGALKEFGKDAHIKLEGRHNATIATGRPDSVYGSVIVEYKKPGTLSCAKDASANKAVIAQLKQRFYDMNREGKRDWKSMFGVGTDGKYFIFLRFRDDKWTDQEPLEVNRYSTERFLWALYNLGLKGAPYQPEYLHGDFGSENRGLAREGVRTLYGEMLTTENPRAQVFLNQWKILFGEVCGYDVENLSDKVRKLGEFYEVKGKPQPAPLLFALHTYYAIFIKLLAAEIVSFFNPWMPRQVEKLQSATSPGKLKKELEDLEGGGIFHQMGITNFLEGDLFSWYLAVWSEPIQGLLRKMISKLDEYNPGTFSEDPAQSRDLLKKLYQHLFPKSVRHDLGEYYTPDWLAEHVLNELGYEGDPDKRLLDPACGSGTFLVMAINRIRRWYDFNRDKCTYDEGELLKKILANVIGFDLNPLAVMAARTNYLVAIKDLIRHVDRVEIPVYLCDSIVTPSQAGSHQAQISFLTQAGVHYDPSTPPMAVKTAVGIFLVPAEIATSRERISKYTEALEFCVRQKYPADDFIAHCRDEGLPVSEDHLHRRFYTKLSSLDSENKNGIWARIIKNNFAPLFVGTVDYVAGNPPWVNWSNLPESYRNSTAPVWLRYQLFPHKGLRARTGSAMDDISVLLTYVSADVYLRPKGLLGFVITQSVFKTEGGGEGFRRFAISRSEKLRVLSVSDLSCFQPFEGAANRTATLLIQKGGDTTYPVPYTVWHARGSVTTDMLLDEVKSKMVLCARIARPISPDKETSPWIVGTERELAAASKCVGASEYQGRYGTHCHASGIYWVDVIQPLPKDKLLIRNLGEIGKTKYPSVEHRVDAAFVFPLARGRDVDRWFVAPRCWMILPQRPDDAAKAVPEDALRREAPDTFAYFKMFEDALRKRSGYKKFFRPGVDPFYSVYNVGDYTFAKCKVMWREVAQDLRAAVSVEENQALVPDHTLVMIPVPSAEEAHYICAMLNSTPANYIVRNYVALHPAPHILKYLRVRRFRETDSDHRRLASLSQRCHAAAARGDRGRVATLEKEVDRAAARVWGITDDELDSIQEGLAEGGESERAAGEDEDDG